MIRVLIIEDSPTVQMILSALLSSDPEIKVVGTAADGAEGVRQTLALKPDLITMDVHMPVMDGFEATQRIMAEQPTPIIVVSGVVGSDPQASFRAIQAGALDVVEKPAGLGQADYQRIRDRLLTAVKLMAEVKVVRRRHDALAPSLASSRNERHRTTPSLVVIGSSTGGPAVLYSLLKSLPDEFQLPIVVVQHMTSGFTQSLADWLQTACCRPIQIARHQQRLQPGGIYLAPEDHHLEIIRRGVMGLNTAPPVSYVRPSATVLFESAAKVYGPEVAGLLITGMGDDGAIGLKAIHDKGGITLVQNEATCVVFGMPQKAIELAAADYILPPDSFVPTLMDILRPRGR
jgi:two-component system chemotaxis response regulator CheB